MNLQEELKLLKERIAELEEQAKQEQEFPKDGDEYWFMSDSGVIGNSFYSNYYIDNDRLEIGNFFKDGEQAKFAVEKLKVEAELRKYSKPFEYGIFNYYIFFAIDSGFIDVNCKAYCPSQGTIYFESEEKAQQAIEAVGKERIKKYIFGVED
ncbi:hypothetical protein CJ191_01250 [Aerococcus viridans]|uniref:Uncharacterized protein n=1 Tax=Aerococcus viridans TaxID=1377 RepID=A0A2N6UFX0_9LACT|nr:hypothetical protein [Aerococcus viridans]PMC80462.1 hypothetical protein CJ191_01250 [Aerococcus viridans]